MEFKIKTKELQDVFNTIVKSKKVDGWLADRLFVKATSDNKVYFGLGHNNGILITKDARVKEEGSTVFVLDTENHFSTFNLIKDSQWEGVNEWTIKKISSIKISVNDREVDYPLNIVSFISEHGIMEMEECNREDRWLESWDAFSSYELEPLIKMDGMELKDMLRQVLSCIDRYEIRKLITGFVLRLKDNQLKVAGTNGVKLYEVSKYNRWSGPEVEVIVPFFVGRLLKRILKKGTVQIGIDEGSVYFRIDNMLVKGKLIMDDKYPEYERLFNKPITSSFRIPISELKEMAMSLAKYVEQDDNCRMTISAEDNRVDIVAGKFYRSYSTDVVGKIDADFNAFFLIQLLKHIDGDRVEIRHSLGRNFVTFHPDKINQRALLCEVRRR